MTSPIDSSSMSPMSGGKSKRGEESTGKAHGGEGATNPGAANPGDQVSISSAGSQLNVAPRNRLEDGAQAARVAQSLKAAFAENGALALAAQGAKVKGELQGVL